MRRRRLLGGVCLAALPLPGFAGPESPTPGDTVGGGFIRTVIARWGDEVLPDAPPFNPLPLTADQADTQFPYDAVIAGLVAPPPAQDGIPRLVAVFANPDAPARMVFPGGVDHPAVAGKLQGATVLNLQYLNRRWKIVAGGYQSRRVTDGTLCQLSGPAAAAIGATVQGLLAPQGGCATPWGTALFAEGDAAPWLTRLAGTGLGFDNPAEAARFGWITELDPIDPGAFPVKRTALGRFARSSVAAARTADGRPVIFMAQDSHDGFLFRFVATASNLDSGTLAVAQIQDNQIAWINLGTDTATLVGTLGAAAAAGASTFDSPGGIAITPDGQIYVACRGNPTRAVAEANYFNPRAGDDNGHIIVLHPPGGDLTAAMFDGDVAIAAGNPASAPFTQYAAGSVWFKNPRTLNLDGSGNLWIGTDQRGKISDTADGLFIMQTSGAAKYQTAAAYLAPAGAAIGGAAFDSATHTAFAMVRHPGATPKASFDNPATRWPNMQSGMPPRSTFIGLYGGL